MQREHTAPGSHRSVVTVTTETCPQSPSWHYGWGGSRKIGESGGHGQAETSGGRGEDGVGVGWVEKPHGAPVLKGERAPGWGASCRGAGPGERAVCARGQQTWGDLLLAPNLPLSLLGFTKFIVNLPGVGNPLLLKQQNFNFDFLKLSVFSIL